jgi:probable HAF family extracellular repeat protein
MATLSDLEPLPGDSYSYATAISDQGQVVGLSLDANFNLRAVVWQNGNITNLNDLVPAETPLFLQTACSINGLGQITGIALAKGTASDYHAYLATPILGKVVEGTSKENAKTLQQWRFGRLASQRSRTE